VSKVSNIDPKKTKSYIKEAKKKSLSKWGQYLTLLTPIFVEVFCRYKQELQNIRSLSI